MARTMMTADDRGRREKIALAQEKRAKTLARKKRAAAEAKEAPAPDVDEVEIIDIAVKDNSDDSDYVDEEDDSYDDEQESDEDTAGSSSDFETTFKEKAINNKKPRRRSPPPPSSTPVARKSNTPNGMSRCSGGGSKKGATAKEAAAAQATFAAEANEAATAAAVAAGAARSNATTESGSGGGSSSAGVAAPPAGAGKDKGMRYVCEIAKSGRAVCRRCDEKITKGALKVGVVTEGSWGPATQWHHMQCTIFKVASAEEVEGYGDLENAVQPLLEQQVMKSQGEVDDMYEPITPDDLVRKEWTEKAQCPQAVMATLLPYQAEGLAWMLNQEKLPFKGGILADEMGMGKTLQAICTIVANRADRTDKVTQERWAKSEEEMGPGGAIKENRGGTLVVCPTIALKQWQSELARFVKPGTLKVLIHHGPKRTTLAEDLTAADVVLTTYAIVENEHRKAHAGNKIPCPDCGRALYPDKMFTHRKYFCGEGAERTEAQAKTQRKRLAPWRRKDSGEKGKGADLDKNNGTTNIRVKVKGRGGGTAMKKGVATQAKKGGGKGKTSADSDETATTSINMSVKMSRRANRAAAAAKGKSKRLNAAAGHSIDSSDDDDDDDDDDDNDDDDAFEGDPRAGKKRKSPAAKGGKGPHGSGKRGRPGAGSDANQGEGEDGGTTDISKRKRGGGVKGKTKGKKAPVGKGGGKRNKASRGGDDDDDSDYNGGTTDITGRGKYRKGKKNKNKKGGAGSKRKRAAGESESEWGEDSGDSDSSSGEDSVGGRRGALAKKEAAFAKVLKDMMDKRDKAEPGVLQQISWQRIMLDEAHCIKDRSTSTAKAVFALTSLYKWCLTGTPLQNRVGELYSLVRFLRLDPHAFYQCRSKNCDCKSLNYRFGPEWRACEECGHTPIMHYANFNRHILNPISRTGYVGEGKKAFLRLKREVLDMILLRRTKSNRSNDICLPPRIVRVRQHRLDEREEDFYQALYTQSQAQFDTYVGSGTILNNYAHIFDILIRLRQAVDHPYLVIYSATKREGMTPAMNSGDGQNPSIAPASAATPTRGSQSRAASASSDSRSNGTAAAPNGGRVRRAASRKTAAAGGDGLGDTSSDSDSSSAGGKVGEHIGGGAASGIAAAEDDSDEDTDSCGICTEPAERPVSSSCGHSFCRACVQELIDTAPGDVECPSCSEPLTVDLSGGSPGVEDGDEQEEEGQSGDRRGRSGRGGRGRDRGGGGGGRGRGRSDVTGRMAGAVAKLEASVKRAKTAKPAGGAKRSVTKHSVINRIDLKKFQSSTKMEALMEEVHLMMERDPAAKAIVFSQFVNMLDLIEYRMHKGQVGCRKLSGHLSIDKRDEVLQAFQTDPGVKVLLISLKAGGVALNLTVANHIFLMDPWWNPAAEMQAIDRTHRLGQFKPIYATRFIIEDTVEERIIKLQEKKQLVFDSTVGGDATSTGKLTVDDLRFLFAH